MKIFLKTFFLVLNGIFFLIASLDSASANSCLVETTHITIDNSHHKLIAPDGSGYQWYLNGEIMFGYTSQTIKATQSGEYTVCLTNKNGISRMENMHVMVTDGEVHKIYIIGDSTVCTYGSSYYPQTGWGQVLQYFLDDSQMKIVNKAIGGRSSRSFHEEGRWTEITDVLSEGDYVFIQFGHNDRDWTKEERYTDTANYKEYLRIYVNETREKGAVPVLVSPMIMHAYNGSTLRNVFTEGENDYRGSMLEVAEELDAVFVDLNMKSYNKVLEVGQSYASTFLYFGLLAGEYSNYPDGHSDGTHFQEMGALEMSKLIVEGLQELSSDTTLTTLIDALVPRYNVNVTMNIEDAGLKTYSGIYPEGVTVTIKTKLDDGYNFVRWEDGEANVYSEDNLTMFTMETKVYSFNAIISDCNSDIGGSAYFDDCDVCVEGSTGNIACTKSYQCEEACKYSGTIETATFDEIERTYINASGESNPVMAFNTKASSAGTYTIGIMCSGGSTEELIDVYVDDALTVSSVSTETNDEWGIIYFDVPVEEGYSMIKVVSRSATSGLMFDFFTWHSSGYIPASCSASINEDVMEQSLQVFPNPFSSSTKISINGTFKYQLFNSIGILITEGSAGNSYTLNNNLESGLYFLRVTNKSGSISRIICKN